MPSITDLCPELTAVVQLNGQEFSISFAAPTPEDTNAPDGSSRETGEVLKRVLRRIDNLTFPDGAPVTPADLDRLPWALHGEIYTAIFEAVIPKKQS